MVVAHQHQCFAVFSRLFNAPQCFVVIMVFLFLTSYHLMFEADCLVAKYLFPARGILSKGVFTI